MDEQLLIHIVRKSIPRFTKSPSLVLIRLVLTEIQRLKTSQFTKKLWPSSVRMVINFFVNFRHFQMAVACQEP